MSSSYIWNILRVVPSFEEKKKKNFLIVLRAFISMKAALHRLENVFDENERATRPVIYDAVEGKVL